MNNPVDVHTKANTDFATFHDVKIIRDDVAGVRDDTTEHAITLGRMDERLKTVENKVNEISEKQGEINDTVISLNTTVRVGIGILVILVISALKNLFFS